MWGKSSRPLRPCSHLIDFTWFYYLMALLVLVSQQHHVTACLSADVGVWLLQLDIVMGAPWPLQLRVSFEHLFCPSVVQIWSATSSVCNRNFSDSYLMLANVWHPVQWHLKSTKIYTGFTFYFKDNYFELHFCFFFLLLQLRHVPLESTLITTPALIECFYKVSQNLGRSTNMTTKLFIYLFVTFYRLKNMPVFPPCRVACQLSLLLFLLKQLTSISTLL